MVQLELFSGQDGEEEPRTLTVGELTAQIKGLLEGSFPNVWVEGEISNFSRPSSGHCYLTLKDEEAQLAGVIWRSVAARLPFALHDGLEVVCLGHLDVYPPRGRYQLVIREIHPKGIGALELAFRQLRDKLAKEGLFDPRHKKPLPAYCRRIAVVTSPTGAAIRDFLEVLRRRWRGSRRVDRSGPRAGGGGGGGDRGRDRRGQPAGGAARLPLWLPAGAGAWRTFGRSTRRSWFGRFMRRGCRWFRPWGTKST
jgi:hypothetical protein